MNSSRPLTRFSGILAAAALGLSAWIGATSAAAQEQTAVADAAPIRAVAPDAEKVLKHKIAVGRFTNETRYGKSLLRDQDLDPLGKQAADIMAAYLAQSEKFLIFERPDLAKVEREQDRAAESGEAGIIGVDTLILGSVVEFGRTTDGQRGLFNRKKIQRAHAKVAVRLVDVRTGLVFHSATGEGEATTETKTVLGIGSTSRFDATLSDRAIAVAIEAMVEELINTMSNRPWHSDILEVQGNTVFISGGSSQGLQVGDRLVVMQAGKTVKSQQTGFDITLPATRLAELQITQLFGDNITNEGAVTTLVGGSLDGVDIGDVFVTESS